MFVKRGFFLALFAILSLSSCGFKAGSGELIEEFETISVCFAEGDWQGSLTQTLINEIATRTSLTYVNGGGDLSLVVVLKGLDENNIGFRYDQNKKGKRIDYIIPTETRLRVLADVTLVDQTRGAVLMGPILFEACYEFDHDFYSARNSVNIFSLGQLSDYDEALDAALKPLYQELSQKIVDYLLSAW